MRLFVPLAAIEPVTVFGKAGKVTDAEITAAGRPVLIVWSGFAKVVVARLHKLAYHPWIVVLHPPVVIGKVAPRTILRVVARALTIRIDGMVAHLYGEFVNTPGTDR